MANHNVVFLEENGTNPAPLVKRRLERSAKRDKREIKNNFSAVDALCKIFLCAAGGIVDAIPQLVQRIKLFAGAEVGVELHHRVGAVKVAGKARDEGLAGHLALVAVDGGPGAETGGRRIPVLSDLGAGDIDLSLIHI